MTSQPRAGRNTQQRSTRRAGQNIQPTNKLEKCEHVILSWIQMILVINQLLTYYLPVCYLLRIQQYPVNTTYNRIK